ncbi:MAG: histidine phosphatase family protein [Clostridia bacterium]|nr:histidine phosphatase family protein [Clostridia bacterium]
MRILLIRHAEPDYPNNTLTPKGFVEADFLSEKLQHSKITHIYSSPLNRAFLTAKPTAQKINKEITVCDWLTEFEGKVILNDEKRIPWNMLPRIWQNEEGIFDIHTLEKSSLYTSSDMLLKYEYVTENLDKLLENHGAKRENIIYKGENNNDTIALFCHFAVGMVIASHLTGISPVLLWQTMFLPTSSVTEFITEERVKGEFVFKCKQMGDTSHLYAKNEPVSNSGLYSEFFGGEGEGAQVGFVRK